MRILLFRGHGMISTLIRWQTRARKYSHAAILFERDELIEAWQGKGVRRKLITDFSDVDQFECVGLSRDRVPIIHTFLESQLGKPFDLRGVWRFVSRRRHRNDESKWFCSELVVAALRHADYHLFSQQVEPWMVDPERISWSVMVRLLPPSA